MTKLGGAIATVLASGALLLGSGAGVAVAAASAGVAAAGQQPGSSDTGGTTLVTVGDAPLSLPATGRLGAVPAQPPVVLETLNVDPAESRAGGSVDLRTFADCGGTSTGQVRSAAFATPVGLALAADGGLYAAARIAPDAKPGTYLVHEFCAGHPVAAGKITIAELGAPATGGGWRAIRPGAAAPGTVSTTTAAAAAPSPLLRDAAVALILASVVAYAALVLRRRPAAAPATQAADADA
ncbi:hypothetical protein [Streptacidiphilus rugosus]|uniref:hypothetical protein n=1 Tax=Streptacidiphilus rugosus TaxID=405783 RepID=UPI00056B1212|nr:hypothetical protein [Streptacidiphilus rugosus]